MIDIQHKSCFFCLFSPEEFLIMKKRIMQIYELEEKDANGMNFSREALFLSQLM